MWQQAHSFNKPIPSLAPCHHGWSVKNRRLLPVWFTGDRVQNNVSYEDKSHNHDNEDEFNDIFHEVEYIDNIFYASRDDDI